MNTIEPNDLQILIDKLNKPYEQVIGLLKIEQEIMLNLILFLSELIA